MSTPAMETNGLQVRHHYDRKNYSKAKTQLLY